MACGSAVSMPSPELGWSRSEPTDAHWANTAHFSWAALGWGLTNSKALSFGSRLDTYLVETRHSGSWALSNLHRQTDSHHGTHSTSQYLWGYFLGSRNFLQLVLFSQLVLLQLVLFLILILQELCGQSMLSWEQSYRQGLKTAFPRKKFLGDLDSICGVPFHECILLCYWRMTQVTNPRAGSYSYENSARGKGTYFAL